MITCHIVRAILLSIVPSLSLPVQSSDSLRPIVWTREAFHKARHGTARERKAARLKKHSWKAVSLPSSLGGCLLACVSLYLASPHHGHVVRRLRLRCWYDDGLVFFRFSWSQPGKVAPTSDNADPERAADKPGKMDLKRSRIYGTKSGL